MRMNGRRVKKAVVTGASGFVGSALIRELLRNGVEVTAIVRPGYPRNNTYQRLEGLDVNIVACALCDIKKLSNLLHGRDYDVFYHCAWDGLCGEALADYTRQIPNIRWTMDAITAAAKLGCKKFVGAGSVTQYELALTDARRDASDKYKVYKAAKLACEYMGQSVAADCKIEFIWPIITNIYGEGEDSPRLVNAMIKNLLAGRRQALSEGRQLYDFIHVEDAARALYLIGAHGKSGAKYTIASGRVRPLREYLCILRDVVSPGAELGFGEMELNVFYLPAECFDISRLMKDTGFQPRVSFEQGIQRTADWIEIMRSDST